MSTIILKYQAILQSPVPEGAWGSYSTPADVLPTDASLNPTSPEASLYYQVEQVAYVLYKLEDNRTRPTRVMTSFGTLDGLKIGSVIYLRHDQTGKSLGRYMVVGVKEFMQGEQAGDIPDIAIKHCVVK